MSRFRLPGALLRSPITVQTVNSTQGWDTFLETKALVSPLGALPQFVKGKPETVPAYKVYMTFAAGLRPSMRIQLSDGRVLKINAIRDLGDRHQTLVLDCFETYQSAPLNQGG